jgi:hypothetical protein
MLTEDSPNWSGRENLHSVKSYGHPLGVTCADWGLCEDAAFLCMSGLGQALRPLARKLLQRAALGGVEPTKEIRLPSLIVPILSSHRRLMHLSNRRPAKCLGRVFRYAFDERSARIPREEAQAQSRIPRTWQTTKRNRVRSCTNSPMGL